MLYFGTPGQLAEFIQEAVSKAVDPSLHATEQNIAEILADVSSDVKALPQIIALLQNIQAQLAALQTGVEGIAVDQATFEALLQQVAPALTTLAAALAAYFAAASSGTVDLSPQAAEVTSALAQIAAIQATIPTPVAPPAPPAPPAEPPATA